MSALVEKKAVDLGLLEEDDQFEEFPNQGNQDWSSFKIGDRQCNKIFFFVKPI